MKVSVASLLVLALAATFLFSPLSVSANPRNHGPAPTGTVSPQEKADRPTHISNKTVKTPAQQPPIVVQVNLPRATQAATEEQKADREERASTDDWMVKLTALIAIATVIQAAILALTIGTTLKQLRPYVSAMPNFIHAFDTYTIATGKFLLRNNGATPAFDVTIRGDIVVAPEPLPKGFRFPTLKSEWAPKFALFPHGEMLGITNASRIFTQQEIDALINGKASIYIYGVVKYRRFQIFSHTTRFAARAQMSEADMRSLVIKTDREFPVSFQTAPQHNDAT